MQTSAKVHRLDDKDCCVSTTRDLVSPNPNIRTAFIDCHRVLGGVSRKLLLVDALRTQ